MAGKQISLNSVVLTPTDIQEDIDRIGDEIQAANGTRRFAFRANKRQWKIAWRRVLASVRTSVRGIYALTSVFTYIDEDGNSFTVYCPPGGFTSKISAISPGVTLYYDIDLTIKEV